ncbi:hypothetical protein IQ244_25060 [Nostoc sp. LEGE 06077]|nr:hypothetical protein [Nostoc sp. LEGE 06077]
MLKPTVGIMGLNEIEGGAEVAAESVIALWKKLYELLTLYSLQQETVIIAGMSWLKLI